AESASGRAVAGALVGAGRRTPLAGVGVLGELASGLPLPGVGVPAGLALGLLLAGVGVPLAGTGVPLTAAGPDSACSVGAVAPAASSTGGPVRPPGDPGGVGADDASPGG